MRKSTRRVSIAVAFIGLADCVFSGQVFDAVSWVEEALTGKVELFAVIPILTWTAVAFLCFLWTFAASVACERSGDQGASRLLALMALGQLAFFCAADGFFLMR